MDEHVIRLRAAWEGRFPIGEAWETRRVDLPVLWTEESRGPFYLERSFHPPRLDPARETLWLRLDEVDGLVSVQLDGRTLARFGGDEVGPREISLCGPLAGRVRLGLQVDPGGWGSETASGVRPWGQVALVVRAVSGRGPVGGDPPAAL